MRSQTSIAAAVVVAMTLVLGLFWWSHRPAATVHPASSKAVAVTPPMSEVPSADDVAGGSPAPRPSQGSTNRSAPSVSPTGTTMVPLPHGANTLPEGTPVVLPAEAANVRGQGMIELQKTRRMILDYHTLMGENPVGTNAEIMKAIMGQNPKEATLGPKEDQQLNAQGELLDPWGTPYFFHQLSGDHMEIHSAGPDRVMGTIDDLILD